MSQFKLIVIYLLVATFYLNYALGIKCRQCDSKDPKCVQEPAGIKEECVVPETEADKKCYTFIDAATGATTRGCTPPPAGCKENDPNCEPCSDKDFCNVKIFPANRRKCHQCSGSNCAVISEQTSALCIKKSDDQCFTNVESDKNIIRGCLADSTTVTPDTCKNNDNCESCSTDNCNNKVAIECHQCSSESNKNCKRPGSPAADCKIGDVGKCTGDFWFGSKAGCHSYYKNNEIIRGCGAEKNTSADITDFTSCTESMCNSKCVNDAKCYICDSQKNPNCNALDKLDEFKKECDPFVSSCHQCENLDGTQATRGCGQNTVKDLVCQNCHAGDYCNSKKLPKSCLVCKSANDPNCASGSVNSQFCNKDDEDCYTLLTKTGDTIRGCNSKSNAECTENNPNCKICKTHNCNKINLVENGLKCFQCSGGGECIKEQTDPDKNAKLCATQNANVQCYTYSPDSGTTMIRGCTSDTGISDQCTKNNDPKCLKCSGNGCNSKSFMASSGMSCIQCDSTDEACSWRFDPQSATGCAKDIPYYETESCYTLINSDGAISRGCTSSKPAGCTESVSNCRLCYKDRCNTESSKTWSCVRCRSDNAGEETCKDKGPKIKKTPCVKVPTNATRGCYTEKYKDVIIRGCLSDLDYEDLINCNNAKYKLCDSCDSQDCNDKSAPSGSVALQGTLSFVVLSSIIVITYFN